MESVNVWDFLAEFSVKMFTVPRIVVGMGNAEKTQNAIAIRAIPCMTAAKNSVLQTVCREAFATTKQANALASKDSTDTIVAVKTVLIIAGILICKPEGFVRKMEFVNVIPDGKGHLAPRKLARMAAMEEGFVITENAYVSLDIKERIARMLFSINLL